MVKVYHDQVNVFIKMNGTRDEGMGKPDFLWLEVSGAT